MIHLLSNSLSFVMIVLIRFYQYVIRPVLPPACRYQPSCSEYFILAVRKHGPIVGAAKGMWRICRCNPFCEGGRDDP